MQGDDIPLSEFRYDRDFRSPAIDRNYYEAQLKDPTSFAAQALQVPSLMSLMQSEASAGNLTKSKEYYDQISKFYRDHTEDVAHSVVIDDQGDMLLHSLKQAALIGTQRQYDGVVLKTPQGDYAAQALFGVNGQYEKIRGDELRASYFSNDVINLMQGEDEQNDGLRKIVKPLVDAVVEPAMKQRTPGMPVSGAGQYNALAHHLATTGAADIQELDEDTIRAAAGQTASQHMADGAALPFYKWMIDAAKQRKRDYPNSYRGAAFINQLASSFNSVTQAIAGGPDGSVADSVTRAVCMSVAAAAATDPNIDLDDSWTRQGLKEIVDVLTVGERAGVKFFPTAQLNGAQVNKVLAAYLVARSQGFKAPESNLLTNLSDMHRKLTDYIVPGWSDTLEPGKADPRVARGQAEGVFHRTSGSAGLDTAAVGLYRAMARYLTGKIAADMPLSDAITMMYGDEVAIGDMAKELSRTMVISEPAARGITQAFLSQMSQGGVSPAGLEKAITDFAFSTDLNPGLAPELRQQLNDAKTQASRWYLGNVGSSGKYFDQLLGEWNRILEDPILGFGNYPGEVRVAQINATMQQARRSLQVAMEKGSSPALMADHLVGQGQFYAVVGYRTEDGVMHEGYPARPPSGTAWPIPVIQKMFGPLDNASQPVPGWVVGGEMLPTFQPGSFSRDGFDAFRNNQAVLAHLYQMQQRLTESYLKDRMSRDEE